jgi:hypothetical protein
MYITDKHRNYSIVKLIVKVSSSKCDAIVVYDLHSIC